VQLLHCADPKSTTNDSLTVFFALLEFELVKASRKKVKEIDPWSMIHFYLESHVIKQT